MTLTVVSQQPEHLLPVLLNVRQQLEQCRSIDEAAYLRKAAKGLEDLAKDAQAAHEVKTEAIEVRLRAERRLGQLLAIAPKNKGADGKFTGPLGGQVKMDPTPTLASQGITRKMAESARALAKVPDDKFEALVSEGREKAASAPSQEPSTFLSAKGIIRKAAPRPEPASLVLTTQFVPGTAWRLGEHLLFCADSSTWQSPIEPKARMAFADPPYGLTSAHWDEELYWEHDWLVDAADFVFVTPGIRNTKRFQPNMPYHWTLTYWMSNSMTHGPVGFSNIQHIELYSKLDSVKVGTGDWFRDTMGSGGVDADSRNHRGQKPISMMVWLMEKFTEPGDWVIDPFLGSGTTLLAAEKIGRRCCGVEKDPEYCQQIIARWQEQTGSQAEPFESA